MGARRWERGGDGDASRPDRSPGRGRPDALAPVAAAFLGVALTTSFVAPVEDRTGSAVERVEAAPVGVAATPRLATGTSPAEVPIAPRVPTASGRAGEGDVDDRRTVPVIPTLPAVPTLPAIPAASDVVAEPDAPVAATGPAVPPGETVPADLVVRAGDDTALDGADLVDLGSVRHHAAAVSVAAVGPDDTEVDVLGVDGSAFRPLTPDVTAAEDAVWERLAEGDVVVTHELADRLDLELGHDLRLTGPRASVTVRIGAFAANGAPPITDVLAPRAVADALGGEGTDVLVVSVADDLVATGDALREVTGGEVELLRPPAPELTRGEIRAEQTEGAPSPAEIEPFTYTSRADGRITIHGDWEARNIVPVSLPGMGTTRCHRTMAPQLVAAVEELIARGHYDHLDPAQFAGCFVARHIDWRPDRPLSMHAWGLAIDFNTRDNPLGARPVMDPDVVAVFERWGFDWGGRWSRPDGMHFELARVVPVA